MIFGKNPLAANGDLEIIFVTGPGRGSREIDNYRHCYRSRNPVELSIAHV
jgi:hypothetical protein